MNEIHKMFEKFRAVPKLEFDIKVLDAFVAEEGNEEERACWAEVKRITSDNSEYVAQAKSCRNCRHRGNFDYCETCSMNYISNFEPA